MELHERDAIICCSMQKATKNKFDTEKPLGRACRTFRYTVKFLQRSTSLQNIVRRCHSKQAHYLVF